MYAYTFMYICIHMYIHTNTHIHVRTYIHTKMHTYANTWSCVVVQAILLYSWSPHCDDASRWTLRPRRCVACKSPEWMRPCSIRRTLRLCRRLQFSFKPANSQQHSRQALYQYCHHLSALFHQPSNTRLGWKHRQSAEEWTRKGKREQAGCRAV